MPYIVLYDGSVVRPCSNRDCGRLGTLSAGARIPVYRSEAGECIRGNCNWLVFEFAGQEAFLHASLAEPVQPTEDP